MTSEDLIVASRRQSVIDKGCFGEVIGIFIAIIAVVTFYPLELNGDELELPVYMLD